MASRLSRCVSTPAAQLSSRAHLYVAVISQLAAPELWRASGFIDGNWTTGQATKSFAVESTSVLVDVSDRARADARVVDPANGEHIGELPEMSVSDVRSAVDAAADAFTAWKRTSEKERHDVLLRLYGLMTRHADDLASIITLENGKPMADAKGEIAYGCTWPASRPCERRR